MYRRPGAGSYPSPCASPANTVLHRPRAGAKLKTGRPPRCALLRPQAHDGALRPATRDLLETRLIEHRLRAEPHAVVAGAAASIDRIGFQQLYLAPPRECNRTIEQRARNTLAAKLARHHEADDRPHRLIVDGLLHRRALQPRVNLARSEREPTHRRAAAIGDQSGEFAGVDQCLEVTPIRLGARHPRWRVRA